VKFKAAGCSLMVASASLLTEAVKGKSTAEAAELTRAPLQFLDGSRCGEPVAEALLSAITQYSDSIRHEWNGDEALICTCFCVSERTIEAEIRKGNISTVIEVTRACRAGAGCRSCWPLIEDILASEKLDDLPR
jgi:NifU-like protein